MSKKTLLVLACVLGPVAIMVLLAATGWLGGQFPNANFVFAYALGATATVLLSVGLFALTFYSSRSGHDEQIGNEQDFGWGLNSAWAPESKSASFAPSF